MRPQVAIIYNEPQPSRYFDMGEGRAVLGVLEAVAAVDKALTTLGHPVSRIPLHPPLSLVRERLESIPEGLVFNLFEGFAGRPETEAMVADLLAELALPYTGCPGPALALALDKARAKDLLLASGINTPRHQLLSPANLSTFHLSYPCIVKPCAEDASHGLSEESVVHDEASLARQVAKISQLFGGQALVEEYLEGREFNATVLGNRALTVLPASEIAYALPPGKPKLLTFASKWEPEDPYFSGTKVVCPAPIEPLEHEEIAGTAMAAFRILGCWGYARVDMRRDAQGRLNVLEVNPNPDISPDTGAARQAAAAGLTYEEFIERIVGIALEESAS